MGSIMLVRVSAMDHGWVRVQMVSTVNHDWCRFESIMLARVKMRLIMRV